MTAAISSSPNKGPEIAYLPQHGAPHDTRPADDLLQEVGAVFDEGEEPLERDEEDPPPGAEPGDRPRDEHEEEKPEDHVEGVVDDMVILSFE
eukprot:CAMPEP_0172525246 /NCGR_PEP_ID=MMETSP1067-20121228/273_1 /TAXON_ID=265564 ORGANISM="Thalassiosira punctigera, Strain Tpunct2005C2" /NCGR_SAMPLE_ID=MMETSP1067 /ASSEMBLY_ACC=CAM_ASM_000444 /LENGTH=91 /DNA_ID=CAMNT_0013308455 /DNA_START=438 /DNA_END=715 /DNA_ORIENTATION=-